MGKPVRTLKILADNEGRLRRLNESLASKVRQLEAALPEATSDAVRLRLKQIALRLEASAIPVEITKPAKAPKPSKTSKTTRKQKEATP